MSDLMERDYHNSEGYCQTCGSDLDITGICLMCSIREREEKGDSLFTLRAKLGDVFTCKVCGQPKTHHRLYGYRCRNPEHNDGTG